MKRWIFGVALCLCVCLLVGGLCGRAEAADIVASGECGNGSDVTWTLDSEGTLTISGSGEMRDYYDESWYSQMDLVKKVIIEHGVTSIGESAFNSCSGLLSVTIPESVTSIGSSAFSGCSVLTSVTIPESVTSIGENAFDGCSGLTGITIPEGVTRIEGRTFSGCTGLTGITIPEGVTSIGSSAFSECTGLTSLTIPESVTSIGDYAFLGCSGLTSITIPEGVASIGGYAFSGCTGLSGISIPRSVANIGADAFFNCPSLNGIWVAEGNPNYSSDRFGVLYNKDKTELLKCPERILGTYTVPESVAKIHFRAFFHCSRLSKIVVTEGNPSYSSDEKGVLYNKDKTTLIVCPSGLSGAYIIPAGVTEIELWAFYGCADLTDVTLPETVTRIKSYTFWDCTGLMHVTIPEGVTSMSNCAFRGCTRLTSVTIPESMAAIDFDAFAECTGLKTVIFLGETLRIWSRAFKGVTAEVYYPESTSEDSFWLQEGALGDYGGSLTWRQWYTLGNDPLCSHVLEDAVVPASCAEEGYTLHKCACGYSYRTDFLTALGHNMVTDAAVSATCTSTGLTEGSHCSRCDYKVEQKVIPALGHDYIDHEAKTATCTEIGWAAYQTCSRCEYTTYKEIPAKGHTPAAAVRENGIDATCTKNGSYDEVIYCSVCHAEQSRESRTIPALGHDYIDHEAKAATCTEIGWAAYQTCSRCEYTTYAVIPALGHDMISDAAAAATCTESGLTEGKHCSRCDYRIAQTVVPALGHDWDAPSYVWADDNRSVTAARTCKRDAAHVESETTAAVSVVTKEATYDTEGEITCTATFKNVAFAAQSKVVKTPKLAPCDGGASCPSKPFRDVDTRQWYHAGVDFAIERGLMNGIGRGLFDPEGPMTRAMLVTVLWRYVGSPSEGTNYFVDVPANEWYTQAVAWAAANGIVNGTSKTTFEPDGNITREQMAAILYRYANSVGIDTSARQDFGGFPDSGSVSGYAHDALSWCIARGIINGSNEYGVTYLLPQGNATRAQVATIFMRFLQNVVE